MLMLMGVFMLLLGVLAYIPVSLGLLPFSPSAQLGFCDGDFRGADACVRKYADRPFPPFMAVIAVGFVFAALGIVSCIIPEILVATLMTVLVVVALKHFERCRYPCENVPSRLRQSDKPRGSGPPVASSYSFSQQADA